MALLTKTITELNAETFSDVLDGTDFTNVSAGSALRTLIEIINQQLGFVYKSIDFNTTQAFLSKSSGFFLDLWGAAFGIPRKLETFAVSLVDDQNVKFYTESGTLRQAAGSDRIAIGTQIFSEDGSIRYAVLADAPIAETAMEVFVSVKSVERGTASAVGSGVLTQHSIGSEKLKVTNAFGISNGSEIETDDNYRFRVANATLASQTSNEAAIRLAALTVAGVADVRISPFARGITTPSVLLIPTTNQVSGETIQQVRSAIRTVQGVGIRLLVETPDFLPIQLIAVLEFGPDVDEVARDSLRIQAGSIFLDYLAGVPIGGRFSLPTAYQQILGSSTEIRGVETLCLEVGGKEFLAQEFELDEDQLLVPREDAENPVDFR